MTTLLFLLIAVFFLSQTQKSIEESFLNYVVDPRQQDVRLYWKNEQQETFRSIKNLSEWLRKNHKRLVFAMNAGMYKPDNSPQGLFIENQRLIIPLDTSSGNGNFYLKPNGVFYIDVTNQPFICKTTSFSDQGNVKYATQSGPMLVIDGQIHPAFKQSSTNLNIRNGVGILPDGKVIFAMSKNVINLH
ncbi:MAG TPA: phosphodiester glycosidase family protein, partial [Chitinophagaceae bacterium]|nr:phosphodiester glycosidase family protein [Chitinophagaceae bacterium]